MKEQDVSERSQSAPTTPTEMVRNGSKAKCKGKRVHFPDEDLLVSVFVPPCQWKHELLLEDKDALEAYMKACERNGVKPLEPVVTLLETLILNDTFQVPLFSLKGLKLDAAQCESLEEIFRRYQFEKVDLENCQLDDDTATSLFEMIEYYESASSLSIAFNKNIDSMGWQACSKMLKKTPRLENLDARNAGLSEHTLLILGRALRLGSNIVSLNLESSNLSGRPLVILVAALKLNKSLEELYLGKNKLSSYDGVQLGSFLRDNVHLRLLDLSNNNLQDLGVQNLSSNCSNQHFPDCGIRVLNLQANNLSCSAIPSIANFLVTSKTMVSLNLSYNKLSNQGIHMLKPYLICNRVLQSLYLSSCSFTCEGAIALAEYIADNPVIRTLDFQGNDIRTAGMMALSLSLQHNSSVVEILIKSSYYTSSFPLLTRAGEDEFQIYNNLLKEIDTYCQRNLKKPAPTLPVKVVSTGRFSVSRVIIDSEKEYCNGTLKPSVNPPLKPINNDFRQEVLTDSKENQTLSETSSIKSTDVPDSSLAMSSSLNMISKETIEENGQSNSLEEIGQSNSLKENGQSNSSEENGQNNSLEKNDINYISLEAKPSNLFPQINVMVENSSDYVSLKDMLEENDVTKTIALLVPHMTRRKSSPGDSYSSSNKLLGLRLCQHIDGLDLKSSVPLSPSHLMETWGFPVENADK